MKKLAVPRWIQSYALFIFGNWLVFEALRLVFMYVYRGALTPEHYHELWETFYIGAKFDARLACAVAIPLGLYLTVYAFWHKASYIKKGVCWFYALIEMLLMLIYFTDFAHYAYISMRVTSSIFTYSENALISAQMLWETYPVVWIILGLLLWAVIGYFFTKKLLTYAFGRDDKYRWKGNLAWFFGGLLITGGLMFGQISQYPLRWSNAYHSTNNFICNLTLNPVLNLFDTYRFAMGKDYDANKARHYYDEVAAYLQVQHPNKETLNYEREYASSAQPKDYNVVLIFMESLAWNKSSFTNPDLDPTPFVKSLADKGILFTNFFTPTSATARAVFATLTGIPDVSSVKTSSRNPLIVDQHLVANALREYEKYYFIGGSSSWGNIRGVIEHNLDHVHMYEEGKFQNEHRNDVWGISDLDLFREANRILEADQHKTGKPFLAIIQTAGYHRPYTIPADNAGFVPNTTLTNEQVHKRSFVSVDEYNSLRLSDHFLHEFFKLAEKSDYYHNTLFVIFGDHGLAAPESENMPRGYVELNLINHQVPLILAGPVIKKPRVVTETASQVDIVPTVMGLLGRGYMTRSIGRDVLSYKHEPGAFLYAWAQTPHPIGFVQGEYYYQILGVDGQDGLYKFGAPDFNRNLASEEPQRYTHMKNMALGLYETSKYLLYNNHKNNEQDQ
ncbi:MAG: sulfatase-like hydrolase/transferase [Elusimicrobiaceae bacterium]|nr:sulfatase-like hydrolase/transferase [Elusimicrobiaceae bacterium]